MEDSIQKLERQAQIIVSGLKNGHGRRYPRKLKDIVIALRDDHGMNAKKISTILPISIRTAYYLLKKKSKNIKDNKNSNNKRTKFRKIKVTPRTKKLNGLKISKNLEGLASLRKVNPANLALAVLSFQILLLALQIFFG